MTDRAAQFRDLYGKLRIADQRRFYEDRRDEYRAAHRQAILLRGTLLVGSASAGVAGQLTGDTGRAGYAVLAAVLAALAGAVTAFEVLIGFPQLRKLYSDAALNLAAAEIDWSGRPDNDLASGVERVEQIFRDERGQWGQLAVSGVAKNVPAPGTAGGNGAGGPAGLEPRSSPRGS